MSTFFEGIKIMFVKIFYILRFRKDRTTIQKSNRLGLYKDERS